MSETVRRAGKPTGKSLTIFSVVLVAIVSGLIACSDAAPESTAPVAVGSALRRASADNAASQVGARHNAMVEAVLQDVAKKRSKPGPQIKLCKMVEQSAIEYARATAANPGEAVRLVKSQDFCGSATEGIHSTAVRARIAEEYGLSARATELLNTTNYLVSVSYSASQLQSYIDPVNAAAMNELDWEEAQIVVSATSVAVSSFAYWNATLASWQSEFQSKQTAYLKVTDAFTDARVTRKYSFWGGVWDVTKADLEGAISGGVGARLAKAAVPEAALWVGGSKSLIKLIQLI